MRLKHLTILSMLFMAMAVPSIGADTVDTTSLIKELYDLQQLPKFKNFRTYQAASTDPTGGNRDWGNFVRENGEWRVLADLKGPGCIDRYWTTRLGGLHGKLRVFIDGETEPRILLQQDLFFDGQIAPYEKPLMSFSSYGWYSYLPIPFEKSCRVETFDSGDFYQLTYRSYPKGMRVESYPADPDTIKSELNKAAKAWNTVFTPKTSNRYECTIKPGGRKVIADIKGPASIDQMAVFGGSLGNPALKDTVIRIYWDGEKTPSVEAPIGDFFGSGFGKKSFESLLIGYSRNQFYSQFPMPFAKSAVIEIENRLKSETTIEMGLLINKLPSAKGLGYFHAKYNRAENKQSIPYTILQTNGKGHFVGCVLDMQGTKELGFLEGDEQIYVDGETKPSIVGTGTEDYFNCGYYYMEGTVIKPISGCTVKDEPNSRISSYRFHLTDCVPFEKDLKVQIEHGGVNDAPGSVYSSVAYWYQTN